MKARIKNAFTLIELLVVIAIIAVLAALILPALSSAKLKGSQVTCLNNTKQLALMAITYQNDYGKGLPRKPGDIPAWSRSLEWSDSVGVAVEGPDVSICPLAKDLPSGMHPQPGSWNAYNHGTAANCWVVVAGDGGRTTFITGSYAANEWFEWTGLSEPGTVGQLNGPGDIGFLTADSVRHPAETPLFTDSVCWTVRPETNDFGAGDLFFGLHPWSSVPGPMSAVTIARHGSKIRRSSAPWNPGWPLPRIWGVNVSFEDGHAARVVLPDLWTLTWNRTWLPRGQPGVPPS